MYRNNDDGRKLHLYMEVYDHYRELIMRGALKGGDRMPSIRKAAEELSSSRTTIESAYLQLAADGYIIAKPQSGYYVTESASAHKIQVPGGKQSAFPSGAGAAGSSFAGSTGDRGNGKIYDFASSGVDRESFRFDLWQRYIKSALRQDERLLTYGEPQGEYDFREALSSYVRDHRNILCSPEQIVVAAGVQSLLHLLCPLLSEKKTVSFPTPSFVQGASVFSDHGFEVHYRDKDADVIYVSPAHMNRWGDIMPVKRRMELISHASVTGSILIEDDYENEFVYLQKPAPSIYGLSREQNVVYIGSFSRLLLPSIRISFMILPPALLEAYLPDAAHYNQTASKAEQIALCQFIRDGHLAAQTRRLRRLYEKKQAKLSETASEIFGDRCAVKSAPAGTMVSLTLPLAGRFAGSSPEEIREEAAKSGLRILTPEIKDDSITFILSCSSMPEQEFEPALRIIYSGLFKEG